MDLRSEVCHEDEEGVRGWMQHILAPRVLPNTSHIPIRHRYVMQGGGTPLKNERVEQVVKNEYLECDLESTTYQKCGVENATQQQIK